MTDSTDSSDGPVKRRPMAVGEVSERRDREGEAMRRRISTRLFGEDFDAVWLGRFRVVEAIGYGAMGMVYSAEDGELDRQVAIKLIRGDRLRDIAGERGRLLREARALARLSHPNIVQVHEVGEHDGGVFIVMELVRGTTLRAWLAAEPRPLVEIVARFIAAGEGLAAAHRVGIVHRDFKPAHALVGEDGRVRIVDFGLTRRAALGMETQLLWARSDARSDQFSFCVALFEAVYGRAPGGVGVVADRRVPGWLRMILARGLATRPEDRHASMTVLIAALADGPRRRRALHYGVTGGLALALALTLTLVMALGGSLSRERWP